MDSAATSYSAEYKRFWHCSTAKRGPRWQYQFHLAVVYFTITTAVKLSPVCHAVSKSAYRWRVLSLKLLCKYVSSIWKLKNKHDLCSIVCFVGRQLLCRKILGMYVFSHVQTESRDWPIKDGSCSVYHLAGSLTSRSFSGWDKSIGIINHKFDDLQDWS